MQRWIEHLDDLPGDLDSVRDIDDIFEDGRDAGRERCLAVAGRPEKQDAPSGIDRRKELANVMLRHDQALEALTQRLYVELLVGDALVQDLVMVSRQADRRRAEIEVLFESFLGRGAAVLAQRVTDRQCEATGSRANRLDQLLVHRFVEQLLDGTTRQFEALGEIEERFAP